MTDLEIIEFARQTLLTEIEALEASRNVLDQNFVQAVRLIKNLPAHSRVVVMGMGKSGHIGNKIAATLASTGTPAFFVHPAEAGHGDLGMITSSDIVLAISQSGTSDELLRVVPYLKRNSIKIIAMTGNLDSALANHATAVIHTRVMKEACPLGLAPTASTTLTLALGDALSICLLKSKGFSAEEFASTHPHGSLGRRLLVTISDTMAKDEAVPKVTSFFSIRSTIGEMSRAALGFVCIVDETEKLLGVFTDGDLRRALDSEIDIKTTPIGKVMAENFVVAHPHQLAVEAVDLMEHHKISSIPIVDQSNILVGALNMRILLQAGIV